MVSLAVIVMLLDLKKTKTKTKNKKQKTKLVLFLLQDQALVALVTTLLVKTLLLARKRAA